MNNQHRDGHIFKRFDSEMRHLHSLVLEMGNLAVSQLQEALVSLAERDVEAARRVIKNDKKINDLDIKADDEIVRIVALRQPMARDLREIIAVSKIIAELERAGDEARKIAGLTIRFYDADATAPPASASPTASPSPSVLRDIHALAEYVEAMLTAVIAAFDDLDLAQALAVLRDDLKLDEHLKKTLHRLTSYVLEDPKNADHFVDIVLAIRALERFGGHAKNIAGHLVFIKHGVDVRHEGVEGILKQFREENGE